MVYFEMVLTFQTRLVYISLGMSLEEPTNIPTHAFSVPSCLAISTTVCKTFCCIKYQTKICYFCDIYARSISNTNSTIQCVSLTYSDLFS